LQTNDGPPIGVALAIKDAVDAVAAVGAVVAVADAIIFCQHFTSVARQRMQRQANCL